MHKFSSCEVAPDRKPPPGRKGDAILRIAIRDLAALLLLFSTSLDNDLESLRAAVKVSSCWTLIVGF